MDKPTRLDSEEFYTLLRILRFTPKDLFLGYTFEDLNI